jgi:hypothetical protein
MNIVISKEAREMEMATEEHPAMFLHIANIMTTTTDDDDHLIIMMTAEETMNRAMALLPDELTAEYRDACRWVPELVEKESNPRWFLR